ncbi:amidohydrolase family protein [Parvularcula sp. ZS-1/3]|uniref:Amidohydrolase family protein n=1 Tax=Parvularcula mediterranea TaxID=2732508 RepID=A0A7Y3W495_9PROT|nr:amidohydrolase family protein [Parvularcula mediterranea]NNU14976.1 amidohydrolase family protein [Parvularcula mediterranea]
MGLRGFAAGLAGAASLLAIAQAQEVTVYTGAKIYPVEGDPIENGVLVIEDDKIIAVGTASETEVPEGAEEVDLSGKVVIPGLVDTHSHIGIMTRGGDADGNERSGPVQPALRAIDAINPGDPGIRMALTGGVTTANIMPGSGNVIGGQTAYVKLRGDTVEEMLIEDTIGGLKMANGENPKGYGRRGSAPTTRMAVAALARKAYLEAQAYGEKKGGGEEEKDPSFIERVFGGDDDKKEAKAPPVNLGHEALLEAMAGDRVVHHHTHRADDVLTVVRLSEEFGFPVVIQHGSEAWKVADVLAEKDIPVSFIIIDAPGGKHEATELAIKGAGIMEKAGVKVALHTDDPIIGSRFFLRTGGLAIREGMTEEGALRALTINGAEMLRLDGRVGSLESGKDADFVVLSGEPFALRTKVLETYIEGEKVYDRQDPDQRLYATGGFFAQGRYPMRDGE